MPYSENSTIQNPPCYYFTLNVVEWVDIFTRPVFKQIVVESLNYFIARKGLVVYGWCLMTNHLHLIARASDAQNLTGILNEFKKFTARLILQDIDAESEVRRHWIMKKFREAAGTFRLKDKFHVWQDANHPVLVDMTDPGALYEELEVIHEKPVRDRIVTAADEYVHSSARDYTGVPGLVNIEIPQEYHSSHFILRHILPYYPASGAK